MYISKTKVKQNKQCKKQLYLENTNPKLKVYSEDSIKVFAKGNAVEKVAKNQFPKAKVVNGFKHQDKLTQTNYFLQNAPVIFEAAFTSNDIFIQIDILEKNEDSSFDAIEVKSGTSVKDEYFEDMLIQYFTILDSKKIKLRNYFIWYINKNAQSIQDLFIKENLIDKLSLLRSEYDELVKDAKDTMGLKEEPDIKIGPQCSNPYDCPFKGYCWKQHLTHPQSVLNLPNLKGKWKLFDQGIEYLTDKSFPIKEYSESNPIIFKALMNNSLEIDMIEVLKALATYQLPLYFFDVETIMTAIPVLKGHTPYQQMVIQYSIHKLSADQSITQLDFLHDSYENPESIFLTTLIRDVGTEGDIVVYNKTFESTRLKELAEKPQHADKKDAIYKIMARLKDLLEVIKKYIYHVNFKGSFSLKSVTPVLIKDYEGYKNSAIKHGDEVSDIYVQFLAENDSIKKDILRQQLLQYNRLDTINVLLIYLFLIDNNFKAQLVLNKIT
jgi:uncharacterized protein YprB with RNaseH-like and TPR domain